MMTFITVSTNYKIPVPDVTRISMYDTVINDSDSLFKVLERIQGVYDVDYDGHYGDYIYLSLDKEKNSVHTKQKITNKINKFITEAEANMHKYY